MTPARMQRLKELVGVSRQTVLRWQQWWQELLRVVIQGRGDPYSAQTLQRIPRGLGWLIGSCQTRRLGGPNGRG